jgi:hypothetical protein
MRKNDRILISGEEAVMIQVEPFVLARFCKGSGRFIILPHGWTDGEAKQNRLKEEKTTSKE